MKLRLAFTCAFFLAVCAILVAQQTPASTPSLSQPVVPRLIRFSGVAKSAGGNGTVGITFTLHKGQQDATALWIETQNVKLDDAGKYTVLLGATKAEGIPMELFTSGEAQWLGVRVDGQPEQPRVLLVSVPYALKAAEAETLAGHAAAEFVTSDKLTTAVEQQFQQSRFNTAAGKKNAVNGVLTSTATNFTDSTTNQVVAVTQNGSGKALVATAASATAISGTTNATSGSAIGVYGSSASTGGVGIFGAATSKTGSSTALFGSSASSSGIAVAANASSTTGNTIGLETTVFSPNGITALFQSKAYSQLISGRTGPSNTEVFSVAGTGAVTSNSGATFQGVGAPVIIGDMGCAGAPEAGISFGPPASCSDYALLGYAGDVMLNSPGNLHFRLGNTEEMTLTSSSLTTGLAIMASGTISASSGVVVADGGLTVDALSFGNGNPSLVVTGSSNDFTGVGDAAAQFTGGTQSSGSGAGILANGGDGALPNGSGGHGIIAQGGQGFGSGSAGYAGVFQGNVQVNGTLNATVKHFKIDHPTDPANQYLYHASVESSEMMTVYSGNVTTNAAGEAIVALPDWFEALNRDFRYQLTVMGTFAQAIVARKIENHQFAIRTNLPNVEVSWLITAVRHDPYAAAHPMQVEEPKPASKRGYYINPELYGAPPEKQVDWVKRSAPPSPAHDRAKSPAAKAGN